jgi:hypothetical protein
VRDDPSGVKDVTGRRSGCFVSERDSSAQGDDRGTSEGECGFSGRAPAGSREAPGARDDDVTEINAARSLPERLEVGGVFLHREPASVLEFDRAEVAGATAARTECDHLYRLAELDDLATTTGRSRRTALYTGGGGDQLVKRRAPGDCGGCACKARAC